MMIFVRIYAILVGYMLINYGIMLIDDVRSAKRGRLSIAMVMEETVQDILRMRPGHTKIFEVWVRFIVALAGLLMTVPTWILAKIRFIRDNTVRY